MPGIRPMRTALFVFLAGVALAASAQPVTFVDRAVQFGIIDGASTLGGTWADWDNDGDPDLYIQNSGGMSVAYRNDLPTGFVDVTAELGIGHPSQGWSACWADFDGDGDTDAYLGNLDDNVLWRNRGNGTFENATAELGVEDREFAQGVCWVDFDMDGRLDLHITQEFVPFRMMKQNGHGTFDDVSEATALNDAQSHSYGLSWADFDGDGDLDCAVATCGASQIPPGDLTIDRLFRNNLIGTGELAFSEIAEEAGVAFQANMYGCEWGDPDNDGDFDLFVATTVAGTPNRFYRNDGTLPLVEAGAAVGLGAPEGPHHGVEWVDYDNDGDLDLYAQNGGGRDRLWHNRLVETGTMTFVERGQDAGFLSLGGGFDGGWADVDGDGDLDLYSGKNSLDQLYINQAANGNGWLFVTLRGTSDTRSGTGATVRVRVGDTWQMRVHGGTVGSFSQHDLPTHFGLGAAQAVDEIEVRWLTGPPTRYAGPIARNQRLTMSQPPADAPGGAMVR